MATYEEKIRDYLGSQTQTAADQLTEWIASTAVFDALTVPDTLLIAAKANRHYPLLVQASKADQIIWGEADPYEQARTLFCEWEGYPDLPTWREVMEAGAGFFNAHNLTWYKAGLVADREKAQAIWTEHLPGVARQAHASGCTFHAKEVMTILLRSCPPEVQSLVNDRVLWDKEGLPGNHEDVMTVCLPNLVTRTPEGQPLKKLLVMLASSEGIMNENLGVCLLHAARIGKAEHLRELATLHAIPSTFATELLHHAIHSGDLRTSQVAEALGGEYAKAAEGIDPAIMESVKGHEVLAVMKYYEGRDALQRTHTLPETMETDLELL